MDLNELFNAVLRIADAADRIANALENTGQSLGPVADEPTPTMADAIAASMQRDAAPAKKPRKKKEESEADPAPTPVPTFAAPAAFTPAPTVAPAVFNQTLAAVEQQAAAAPFAAPVAAPAPAQPTASAAVAAAPVAAPAPAQPTASAAVAAAPSAPRADLSSYAVSYTAQPVERQFAGLLELFMTMPNQPAVRDALTKSLENAGLALPISAPENRSLPNAAYTALDNNTRWGFYETVYRAIETAKQAAQS